MQLYLAQSTFGYKPDFDSIEKISNFNGRKVIIDSDACDPAYLDPKFPSKCSSDCKSLIYCNKSSQPTSISPVLCYNSVTKLPYCNQSSRKCAKVINSCVVKTSGCTQGYSVDLKDCYKITYCDGTYKYIHYCLNNTVADPKTFNCVQNSCYVYSSTTAAEFKGKNLCEKKPEGYRARYPLDLSKFVICQSNAVALQSCSTNYVFNEKMQKCVFQCPDVGRYPNPDDPATYYECVGVPMLDTLLACPAGATFDVTDSICK